MAEQAAADRKLSTKHRWRGKIFSNVVDEAVAKEAKQKQKLKLEEDVADFLKPSTQKSAPKPRIDIAAAQRYPGAHDIHANTPSPGHVALGIPSSLRGSENAKPKRAEGLTVSFVRTAPEIIGVGGEEYEEAPIEVSRRKGCAAVVNTDRLQGHKDDSVVGLRSPKFNGPRGEQANNQAAGSGSGSGDDNDLRERPPVLKRAQTSHGEISPPLQQKLEMGIIASHAPPLPPPPQRLGTMGLSERPPPIKRAPTGLQGVDDGISRPSMDSTFSMDSEDFSPHPLQRSQTGSIGSVAEENEDGSQPKALRRTQTGFGGITPKEDDPPRLPEMDLGEDDSPVDFKKHFLESEPSDPNSFAARVQHKMRAEEGRALHEAAARRFDTDMREGRRPSTSSSYSQSVGSPQSYTQTRPSYEPPMPSQGQLQPRSSNGTRPSQLPPAPPPSQLQSRPLNATRPSQEPPPQSRLQPRPSDATRPSREPSMPQPSELDPSLPEPRRSHARKPSQDPPIRKPLPTSNSMLDVDTQQRPSSSSSANFSIPLAHRNSPIAPASASNQKLQVDHYPSPTNNSLRASPLPTSRSSPSYVSSSPSRVEFSQPLNSPALALDRDPGMQVVPPQEGIQAVTSSSNQDPGMQVVSPSHQDGLQVVTPSALYRSDTRSQQGDAALADFADRVTHMQGIFRLTAELERPLHEVSLMQWLRAGIWWFLRGRTGMESLIRSRPRGDPMVQQQKQLLTQPHVDLAKTWWILAEVVQNHPALRRYGDSTVQSQAVAARGAGDIAMAEIFEVHDVVLYYLKLLLASMKRHQVMPPQSSLVQGQDQTIWIRYPNFSPDAQTILSGHSPKSLLLDRPTEQLNPANCMPLGDTKADFCYSRMFVQVSLTTEEAETDRVTMPCVLSILRPRDAISVKVSICSLNELVNICVQNDKNAGPTWEDVNWKVKSRGMYILLPRGFTLHVEFNEPDFRTLWAIVDHTNKVEANLRPREDERIVYDLTLRDFQYTDPTNPQVFPQERIKRCRTVIFEKCARSSEGGKRRLHRGYRFVVVTNPRNRTLSCVNHELGKQVPLNFEFKADAAEGGFPAIVLRVKEDGDKNARDEAAQKAKQCVIFLVFNDGKDRNMLFGTLTGMNVSPDETVFAQVPLKSFNIENADQAEGFSHSGKDVLKRLHWQDIKTLNLDPEAGNMDAPQTVLSESLRVVTRHSAGSLTDRMNMNPGELLIRLQTSGSAEISVLRNPQEDMGIAIDVKRTEPDIPDELAELLRTVTFASTLRSYLFHNLKDLHEFQMAITGFYVKFDGIASTFAIARRRMVVPIYKRWEASTVRLQIVQQDNICQLLAFFEDFSHADAMNFQLKSMDVFEKIERGGKHCVRLVDAKFALPVEERKGEGKIEKAEGRKEGWAGVRRRFVCLDVVEYPGEHDDIVVGFDTMAERDRFAEALPAATQIGRQITFKRKI
ncbi:hypothetical protein K432DRAFT_409670 [Lepidopterella palustris CBS 459.81]|uniref:Uncharacterized protein n=1 Tax=Lepidopterella palustris CBS 459.81 TaxID=1314670 RepID=A0A8E2J9R4_9PEZI|nr:hypothetical protein K432DRAFT_409670 [Lepidopterella palustris CBS 459.81]